MSIADQYKIVEKLGTQKVRKFGQLYLVENKTSGERAVLKSIQKSTKNQHIVQRLQHEAKFTFDFPGLPEVIEQFESDTEYMVLRAYKEGTTLDTHWNSLKRKQRLTFLVNFIEQLAVLFDHLTTKGMVHCDIKPSNLLISNDGTVELIDFGLALDLNAIDSRNILFPLGFAAPELILNRLSMVNQSTDIYALGILIWRLYTGKLPLIHPNPSIFTNLQLTHPLPNDGSIPKRLFPILEKMTAKHQFQLPPNKMERNEVDKLLRLAISQRYTDLTEVIIELQELNSKRSLLPKKIFSKS